MQVVRGEDPNVDPLALVTPFVILTLPLMAGVAGLAVLFEVTPGLRGGFGNVVYFFVWISSLTLTAAPWGRGLPDPLGGEALLRQMHAACVVAFPDFPSERNLSMGFNFKAEGVWDLRTFAWGGAVWTPAVLLERAAFLGLGIGLPLLGAAWFDRFDAHVGPRRGKGAARRPAPRSSTPAPANPSASSGDTTPEWAMTFMPSSSLMRGTWRRWPSIGTPPARVEPPETSSPSLPCCLSRAARSKRSSPALTEIMPSSTLAWQWSHDRAHADPVTDTGRNRLGLEGFHSGVSQRLRPGA